MKMKHLILFIGENNDKIKEASRDVCELTGLNPDDYKVHTFRLPALNIPDNTDANMYRARLYNMIKAGINSIDLHYLDQYMGINEQFDSLNREYIADSILMLPIWCAFAIVCNGLCDRI